MSEQTYYNIPVPGDQTKKKRIEVYGDPRPDGPMGEYFDWYEYRIFDGDKIVDYSDCEYPDPEYALRDALNAATGIDPRQRPLWDNDFICKK